MAKIVIWMPREENQAGHVAIATNDYYVSFWPANCLEKVGKNFRTISNATVFLMEVHRGCLVFDQDFDKENEGDCDPDYEHEIDVAKVSNKDLNAVIEEFLRYNGIDPEDVTLAKGEEKYEEYKQLAASLTPEEAKRIEDLPVKLLAKTKYSIVTELVSSKRNNDSAPFYNSQQSCVSFAFNLIQTAWLKHHPNPIPIVNYEEAQNASEISFPFYLTAMNFFFFGKKPKQLPYKVPWFEKEVVRRYLITDELINQPIISAQRLIINELLRVKPAFFSTFVLLLIGYFFPETGYPNVFIYWNFVVQPEAIYQPSFLSDFILPLSITLFAHHFSWGVAFLAFLIYRSFQFIMKYNHSGEFWQVKLNRFLVEVLSFLRRFADEMSEHSRVVLGREPESPFELLRVVINYRRAN